MLRWTPGEIDFLRSRWKNLSDREISILLGRSLESVRYQRQRILLLRWASRLERWIGEDGRFFADGLVREYERGTSQAELTEKYRVEWSKLRTVLLAEGVAIRDKSQQAFLN